MQLPSFPTVSQDCLLHPLTLSVRYMLDANLPGECCLTVVERLWQMMVLDLKLIYPTCIILYLSVLFDMSLILLRCPSYLGPQGYKGGSYG